MEPAKCNDSFKRFILTKADKVELKEGSVHFGDIATLRFQSLDWGEAYSIRDNCKNLFKLTIKDILKDCRVLHALSEIQSLRQLTLRFQHKYGDQFIESIRRFNQLTKLDITAYEGQFSKVQTVRLCRSLPKLESLGRFRKFQDEKGNEEIRVLAAMTGLREIGFEVFKITQEFLERLFDNLPNLKRIRLRQCGMGDEQVRLLAERMKDLEYLDISANRRISTVGVSHLRVFSHSLKYLNMQFNHCFCESGVKFVSQNFQALEKFKVSSKVITNSSVEAMTNGLKNMKSFRIRQYDLLAKPQKINELIRNKPGLLILEINGIHAQVVSQNLHQLQKLTIYGEGTRDCEWYYLSKIRSLRVLKIWGGLFPTQQGLKKIAKNLRWCTFQLAKNESISEKTIGNLKLMNIWAASTMISLREERKERKQREQQLRREEYRMMERQRSRRKGSDYDEIDLSTAVKRGLYKKRPRPKREDLEELEDDES